MTTPGTPIARRGLCWREVRLVYSREMRGALREKAIVANSILIPLFLYPFLLWAAFTGILFVTGQTENFVSRVAVRHWPKEHPKLQINVQRSEQFDLVESSASRSALEKEVRAGTLDAVLDFLPASGEAAALAGNFKAEIIYDGAKDRSAEAHQRLNQEVDDYRVEWLRREARRRGVDRAAWQGFTMSTRNLASNREMGRFLLGLTAPVLFMVMVAVGCFYPAVDATAGERERNTWETLISTAASPLSIVTGKYLYVATMGAVAGVLNLAAIMVTLKPLFAPLLAKAGRTIEAGIPVGALPIALLAGLLMAGFIAAGMMIFASFARTFKEGQAMITPFYLLVLLPVVFLQAPGLKLSAGLACVPVVNLTLVVREAILGTFQWPLIGLAMAVSLGLIIGFLRLATRILQFEDLVLGSYSGSFVKFLRDRLLKPAQPALQPKGMT